MNDGKDPQGRTRQPWFGPKRFGYGWGPRTWQGFLVVAVLIALLIAVATVTGGHGPLMPACVAAVIVVPFIIAYVQRR